MVQNGSARLLDPLVRFKYQIPMSALWPFLIMTFGLAWGILALFIFQPEQMAGLFGPLTGQHPLFFLAVYAPAIAAFTVVLYKTGVSGFQQFLTRLFLWKSSVWWNLFLFLGIPLVFIAGSLIKGNLLTDPFPFSSFPILMTAILMAIIKGPVEEFGWRGLALPLLQRKFTPVWSALILGIIWGIWHLPAFLLSGTQQGQWSFAPFFFGCIALSMIVTPLFNQSRGSLLIPAFFHFMLMNPIFPDAQPYDSYLMIAIAILVVWVNRKTSARDSCRWPVTFTSASSFRVSSGCVKMAVRSSSSRSTGAAPLPIKSVSA
jgi:membrane protease YdiL (CAAX protease family)